MVEFPVDLLQFGHLAGEIGDRLPQFTPLPQDARGVAGGLADAEQLLLQPALVGEGGLQAGLDLLQGGGQRGEAGLQLLNLGLQTGDLIPGGGLHLEPVAGDEADETILGLDPGIAALVVAA